ncbi:nucleotidyltransferase family protein [Methanobacterium formicicum]|uniref:Nucleotidyltransferase family protein n=1 Tax=Methanobacterium formicicum (strain DSM 3637 / PP1) TaxID=1204725 RepID=K2R1H5_METFP|nr:nucleotidyltransferase family protein [Methanobacterium formicicum]EKF86353.1 hypothetical protein A994_02673 [Methanobacterium formicicum DSM 3637]
MQKKSIQIVILVDSIIKLKNEEQMLLQCARTQINYNNQKKIISLVRSGLDWEYLLKLAVKHKLQQLLYWQINQISLVELPPEVFKYLSIFFRNNATKNLFYMKEILNIVNMLSEMDIISFPYKGPILAQQVYGNLSMRQFGDLDLLVRKEDVTPIKKILISQGYKPEFDLDPIQERNYLNSQRELKFINEIKGVSLELHWKFSGIFLNLPRNAEKLLLDNLNSINIGGVSIPIISPENMVLILSIHNASHYWSRLSWLADIATLIDNQKIEWAYVLETAQKLSIKRILLINLYLCHILLDLKLDKNIISLLSNMSIIKTSNIFIKNIFSPNVEYTLIDNIRVSMKIRENKVDGLKDCFIGIFNPSFYELNNLKLPSSLFFLYYIYRPLNLLKRYKLFKF